MRIALASDHAGFRMKQVVKEFLSDSCLDVIDFGVCNEEPTDYPVMSIKAAEAVAKSECDLGIIICGTGIGSSIAANKVMGIRAALCHCTDFAILSRKHNNANVLVLPGRFIGEYLAKEIVKAWLNTPFEGERHSTRISMISKYEERGEL